MVSSRGLGDVYKRQMLISVGALSNRAVTKLSESLQEVWPGIKDPLKASLLARTMTERARGHPNTAFAVACMGEPLSFSDTVVTSTPDLNPIKAFVFCGQGPQHEHMGVHMLSLIHISEPTRRHHVSRMPSSA